MATDDTYNQNSIQIWSRVRDGSVLLVDVEAGDGVLIGARIMIDLPSGKTEERIWTDHVIRAGTKRLKLSGGRDYVVRLRVGFTSSEETEALISARIEKPDGSLHGRQYRYLAAGSTDKPGRCTITIKTRSA